MPKEKEGLEVELGKMDAKSKGKPALELLSDSEESIRTLSDSDSIRSVSPIGRGGISSGLEKKESNPSSIDGNKKPKILSNEEIESIRGLHPDLKAAKDRLDAKRSTPEDSVTKGMKAIEERIKRKLAASRPGSFDDSLEEVKKTFKAYGVKTSSSPIFTPLIKGKEERSR